MCILDCDQDSNFQSHSFMELTGWLWASYLAHKPSSPSSQAKPSSQACGEDGKEKVHLYSEQVDKRQVDKNVIVIN